MSLKIRILLLTTGLIGAYTSAILAWEIYRISRYGEIRLLEPVRWIVISEFIFACVFSAICLAGFVVALMAKEHNAELE